MSDPHRTLRGENQTAGVRMSAHPSQHGAGAPSPILERVRQCAASVTRYPLDILTGDAQLEDELGIDSVKLAELVAVVAREFQLPADRLPPGGKARTLSDISGRVAAVLAESAPSPTLPTAVSAPSEPTRPVPAPVPVGTRPLAAPVSEQPSAVPAPARPFVTPGTEQPIAVPAPVPPVAEAPASDGDLMARVRSVFARVTRYPEALLTPHADLEDELGIDSVKQAEVLAVLMKELGLREAPKPGQRLRSLAAVTEAARSLMPPTPRASDSAPRVPLHLAPSRQEAPREELPFAGKVAFVTGSGKGIGRVIAMRLARAGATVVVNSFHSREEGERTTRDILAEGGKALHVWGSVAQEDHLTRMFSTLKEELGGLDFLVCNASNGLIGPFDQITPRDWDKAFRTCITGTYECAMRARPLMAARGGGNIVTMSTSVSQRYIHGLGCQGVVKAGVESLTRYLAAELAPEGIRTNCVSAGPVHGELLGTAFQATERIAHWEAATPGGRLCTADDVADVTELLLGPKTRRVNGAIWVVDAGLSGTVDGRLPTARAS